MGKRSEGHSCNGNVIVHVGFVIPIILMSATHLLKGVDILERLVVAVIFPRAASAACHLTVFMTLSVKVPSHELCVRPPSYQHVMWILRLRCLVNSQTQAPHLCVKLSVQVSASGVALLLIILCMCINLLFLIEMPIGAVSSRDPFAIDVEQGDA